jgi:hypothetical protein
MITEKKESQAFKEIERLLSSYCIRKIDNDNYKEDSSIRESLSSNVSLNILIYNLSDLARKIINVLIDIIMDFNASAFKDGVKVENFYVRVKDMKKQEFISLANQINNEINKERQD